MLCLPVERLRIGQGDMWSISARLLAPVFAPDTLRRQVRKNERFLLVGDFVDFCHDGLGRPKGVNRVWVLQFSRNGAA